MTHRREERRSCRRRARRWGWRRRTTWPRRRWVRVAFRPGVGFNNKFLWQTVPECYNVFLMQKVLKRSSFLNIRKTKKRLILEIVWGWARHRKWSKRWPRLLLDNSTSRRSPDGSLQLDWKLTINICLGPLTKYVLNFWTIMDPSLPVCHSPVNLLVNIRLSIRHRVKTLPCKIRLNGTHYSQRQA